MKFNVNDHVRVRLTDEGRAILRRQHDDLVKGRPWSYDYVPPKEDADGWSDWQLWVLMQQLGHTCGNGAPLTFETTIEIVH